MHSIALLLLLCAPAPREGDTIAIVEEAAVIVWEPETKTQHFIRRATFLGEGRDFGFLVPTPTRPALAEVDSALFDALERHTKRKTVHEKRHRYDFSPLLMPRSKSEDATTAAAGVSVLETTKLAGYEAAVLDASDAAALQTWLREHGYAASEDLTQWLETYVRQRWTITAFKVDPEQEPSAQTAAVKMSFVTERPFFPYREPASQKQRPYGTARALKTWFLGPERVGATIGADGHWAGVLMWSNTLDDAFRASVASRAGVTLPAATRLTAHVDTSSIRSGSDELFFARDADQRAYIPPPHVIEDVETTHIPIDVVIAFVVAIGIAVRILTLRRRFT